MATGIENLLASLYGLQSLTDAASAYSQASAIESEGAYQSSQLEINAGFSEIEAADAIKRGDKAANNLYRRMRELEGEQVLTSAASGIDPFSGSAKSVRESDQLLGDLDIIQIKTNAWRESFGYKTQASNFMNQAEYVRLGAKQKARNTLITGGLKAVNSGLLSGYYASDGVKKPDEDEIDLPSPSNVSDRNIFSLRPNYSAPSKFNLGVDYKLKR